MFVGSDKKTTQLLEISIKNTGYTNYTWAKKKKIALDVTKLHKLLIIS